MIKEVLNVKILSIILILAGLGGLVQKNFIGGLLFLAIGIWLFAKKSKKKPAPTVIKNKAKDKNSFTFNIAGVTKEGRQNIIKDIVNDWKEYNLDDIYEGLKNKEIKDLNDDVYEVDIEDWCDIELIPEPDNKYDPNAIKIISDFGELGYVPADSTEKVKSIMEKKYDLNWRLVGGKYKYYDEYENKIITETLTYGIEVNMQY